MILIPPSQITITTLVLGPMNKLINFSLLTILAILVIGCTSDDYSTDLNFPNKKGEKVTIKVGTNLNDSTTRIIYDGIKLATFTWEKNDSLIAVGYDTDGNYQGLSMFKLVSGADSIYATFSGGKIGSATKYDVYYKNKALAINPSTGIPTYNPVELTQNNNDNTKHLKSNLYLASFNVIDSTNHTTEFSNMKLILQNCIMEFNLSNISTNVGKLKQLVWEDETSAGTKSISLLFAKNSVDLSSTSTQLTAYFAFMPSDMSTCSVSALNTQGRAFLTIQGENNNTYIARKKIGEITFQKNMGYPFTINKGWTKLGESVDLGLPSSTKWATYNIGAISSTDAGYYYAWGETDMQIENTSASYKYAKENIGTEIQGTDYDVATAKWGSSWTMPTKKQMQELIDNGTWTWDATKKGYTVTGKNGNSIFLPAAGYRTNSTTSGDGSELRYWCTESSGTMTNIQGYGFSGNSTSKTTEEQYNTYYGFTVRPVTK